MALTPFPIREKKELRKKVLTCLRLHSGINSQDLLKILPQARQALSSSYMDSLTRYSKQPHDISTIIIFTFILIKQVRQKEVKVKCLIM